MDRDIGSDDRRDLESDREDRRSQPIDPARAGSNASPYSPPNKRNESRTPLDHPSNRERPNERTRHLGQTKDLDRERQISLSALEAAREIGRFRALAVDDLRRLQYRG